MRALSTGLISLFLLLSHVAEASEAFVIKESPVKGLELGTSIQYLFDEDDQLTMDAVAALPAEHWQQSFSPTPSFGFRRGSVWIHLKIRDLRIDTTPLVLELAYPTIDEFEVYGQGDTGWKKLSAGDHILRADWPLDVRFPSFPLKEFNKDGIFDLYMKQRSTSSVTLPLKIFDEASFQKSQTSEESVQSLYFGALLVLGLYNFLVYLSTRMKFYLSYVIYLSGTALFQASYGGHWHYYLSDSLGLLNDQIVTGAISLITIGISSFVLVIFELRKNERRNLYWRRIGMTLMLLSFINFILGPLLPYFFLLKLVFTLGVSIFVFSFASAFLAFHEGERMARWFLLAWSFFLIGALVNLFRVLGVIPANVLTLYAQQWGSAIQFTLLSFAMADHIKSLQENVHQERDAVLRAELAARQADQRALEASQDALAEQRRLSQLKDQFIANTSHELRTPINGMIGMSESLMSHSSLGTNEKAAIQEILGASRRLSKLVNDILDFGASENGSMVLEWEHVSLNHIVHEVLSEDAPRALAQAVSLRDQLESDPWVIYADANRVTQVLKAIFSNAFKFTEKGHITLRARHIEDYVELVIRDTGIGIAADRLGSLSTAFEQGDGSSARRQGGTGLGLALATRLMKALEGSLQIQSALGLGTTVVLRFRSGKVESMRYHASLPVVQTSTALKLQEPAQAFLERSALPDIHVSNKAPEPYILGRTKILVVDDDDLNRRVLREHLSNETFEVFEAASGKEALEQIKIRKFDALLLDVMMPGMTGYEVCRTVRTYYSPTDLPVLMLTAKQQVQDLIEGFRSGANDYVHKPFVKDEILARLQTHLGISLTARAMQKFVPQDYIKILGHKHLTELALGEAVEMPMGILFTDIVGFTKILETMKPSETFAWLNRCYRILGPEIRKTGGFIDKYIGDGVMALFPESPDAALSAALAMNHGAQQLGDIKLGTGLHWGQTMLGTLGEPERFETTVLSDAVNIASRVEGASRIFGCQIVVTSALKDALKKPKDYRWRRLGHVRFKGREGAIELFEVLDAAGENSLKFKTHDEFEAGIVFFQKGEFMKAMLHFQSVLDLDAGDLAAEYYLKRCRYFQDEGVKNFDGVLDLSSKS